MRYSSTMVILFAAMKLTFVEEFEKLCKEVKKPTEDIVGMATRSKSGVVSEIDGLTVTYWSAKPSFTEGHLKTLPDEDNSNTLNIKRINIKEGNEFLAVNEVKMLNKFKRNFAVPQIVEERECIRNEYYAYIVTEGLKYNLVEFAVKKMGDTRDYILWQFMVMMNLAQALSKLHDMKIIHRSIIILNLYMRNKYDVVIGDLGLAIEDSDDGKVEYDSKMLEILSRTTVFNAPEIATDGFSFESDIYSLGYVYYFLSTHELIVNNLRKKPKMLSSVENCIDSSHFSIKRVVFCVFMRPLIKEMVSKKKKNRPTARDLTSKINETLECLLFYMFKGNWGHEEFIDPSLISKCQKFEGIKYIRIVKDKPTNDVLHNFLSDFTETLDENYENKQSHALELIKNNALFFNALPDRGESILGSPIDDYISCNPVEENEYVEVKPKKKKNCLSFLCSCFTKKSKLVI